MLTWRWSILRLNRTIPKKMSFCLLAAVVIFSINIPAYAQGRISISKVRLEVTIYDDGGRIRPEVKPAISQAKYYVGNVWKSSEFKDSFFDEEIADIYESPSFVIEVQAESGYYFSSTDIIFKGFDVKCAKSESREEDEILYLLCEFGSLSDWGESVADKRWESAGIATWQSVAEADVYSLKLFHDSKIVGSSYITKGNRYDFRPLMLEEGNYYYTIQAEMSGGTFGETIASEICYVSRIEADQFTNSFAILKDSYQAQLKGIYQGWQQSGNRWWYRNEDNTYEQDNWKLIDNVWYYFDRDGYMIAGQWINWKGQNYFLMNNGALQ